MPEHPLNLVVHIDCSKSEAQEGVKVTEGAKPFAPHPVPLAKWCSRRSGGELRTHFKNKTILSVQVLEEERIGMRKKGGG